MGHPAGRDRYAGRMDNLPMTPEPTWRKPAGIGLILLLISVWAALVASLSNHVGAAPWPLQAIFYLIAGTIWILPLKPLLRWMETGKWQG